MSALLTLWVIRRSLHIDKIHKNKNHSYITENRYIKCLVHFFSVGIFSFIEIWTKHFTNRTAGKQMNIKKVKLLFHHRKNIHEVRITVTKPIWRLIVQRDCMDGKSISYAEILFTIKYMQINEEALIRNRHIGNRIPHPAILVPIILYMNGNGWINSIATDTFFFLYMYMYIIFLMDNRLVLSTGLP